MEANGHCTITYIAACHAHSSNEGCHCRSPTKQCSSYSERIHLQLLNRVTLKLNAQLKPRLKHDCAKKTSNLHPSDLCWNAYRSQVGFSKPARPSPQSIKLKKGKFSKKIFANTLRFAKFAKIFFRELFPLYGTSSPLVLIS